MNIEKPSIDSLAVVLPRYGKSLGGGAETLARELALHALSSGSVGKVEVWTTCAMDHRTWENELPPGVTSDGDITVRRFPVDARNLEDFIRVELAIQKRVAVSIEDQLTWLGQSVNSRALYSQIAKHGPSFDALLFAPYLFATSFWGALIHPSKSLVIPCLHDEPYAYLNVFRPVFEKVRGCIFNAQPEADLAERIFGISDLAQRSAVVGMGFLPRELPKSSKIRTRPYLLYSGRKEQGKNLDLLINCYEELKLNSPDLELDLVIVGAGDIGFRSELPSGCYDLGFVSEEDKLVLMRDALALCQPSVNESFSIVIMEAWQMGTPVIVHSRCAVTRYHVVESSGGLFFDTAEDFMAVVKLLIRDKALARKLGASGQNYVANKYSWSAVIDRFRIALKQFGLSPANTLSDTSAITEARAEGASLLSSF